MDTKTYHNKSAGKGIKITDEMDLLPVEKWIYIKKDSQQEGSWVYICEKNPASENVMNNSENSTTFTTNQEALDNTMRPPLDTIPKYQPDVNQLLATTQYSTRTTDTTIFTTANNGSTYNQTARSEDSVICESTMDQTTSETIPMNNPLKSLIMNTPLTNSSNSSLTSYSTMMNTTWETPIMCTTTTPTDSCSNESLLNEAKKIEEILTDYRSTHTPTEDLTKNNNHSLPVQPTTTTTGEPTESIIFPDHIPNSTYQPPTMANNILEPTPTKKIKGVNNKQQPSTSEQPDLPATKNTKKTAPGIHKKRKSQEYDPEYPQMDTSAKKSQKCPECRRIFVNKGSLTRHISSQHKDDAYICSECGLQTTRKDSLRGHYIDQHPLVELPYFVEKKEKFNDQIKYKNVRFNVRSRSKDILKSVIDSQADDELIQKLRKTISDHKVKC